MSALEQLLPTLLPIAVCSGIGFAWVKTGAAADTKFLSALVSNVALPCLLFSSFDRPGLTAESLGASFLAGALALVCFGVVGLAALAACRLDARRYLPALMLPNTSNLGLPVVFFAFGEQGLVFAVPFSALVQIGHFTVGIWLASGRMSLRPVALGPTLYCLLAALAMLATGTRIPPEIAPVAAQLGGMAVPLMLLMLGMSLGRLSVSNLPRTACLSLVRVAGGFGIGVSVAAALGLPHAAAGAFVIQCSMPVAVLSWLFAEKFRGPAEEIAGMVLVSTIASMALLPLVLTAVA